MGLENFPEDTRNQLACDWMGSGRCSKLAKSLRNMLEECLPQLEYLRCLDVSAGCDFDAEKLVPALSQNKSLWVLVLDLKIPVRSVLKQTSNICFLRSAGSSHISLETAAVKILGKRKKNKILSTFSLLNVCPITEKRQTMTKRAL
jgi:hypothetical protein